ncbi:unnamed protein product [Peniophora sp. CBMAI 1063]|nr:unnamed protein product [Peniophora sp. CBMAI 1063]
MSDANNDGSDHSNPSSIIHIKDLAEFNEEPSLVGKTPMREFRPGGCLTVTDICQPAWCEKQYAKDLDTRKRGEFVPGSQRSRNSGPGTQTAGQQTQSSGTQVPARDFSQSQRGSVLTQGEGSATWKFNRRIQNVHSRRLPTRHRTATDPARISASSNEEKQAKLVVCMIHCLEQLRRFRESEGMHVISFLGTELVAGRVPKLSLRKEGMNSVITLIMKQPSPKRTTIQSTERRVALLKLACYHRLLSDNLSQGFSFQPIWNKLGVQSGEALSDGFVEQASDFVHLDCEHVPCLSDYATELSRRRDELQNVIIDPTMIISYEPRAGTTGPTERFKVDYATASERLDVHLPSVLAWWRGERQSKGVDVEDAWKCRPNACNYEKDCLWRRTNGGTRAEPLPVRED